MTIGAWLVNLSLYLQALDNTKLLACTTVKYAAETQLESPSEPQISLADAYLFEHEN